MAATTIELKTAGVSITAVLLIEWGANTFIHLVALPPILIIGIARASETAALIWIAWFLDKNVFAAFGIRKNQWLAGLQKGLLWSAGFGLLAGAAYVLLLFLEVNPLDYIRTEMPRTSFDILLFFVVGALISPIAEEVFFRGILYGFFRRWGIAIAVLASTALFVAAHALSNRIPVTQAVGGVLFAVAYEKEKNLMVPIVIHILGNLAIFSLALLAQLSS